MKVASRRERHHQLAAVRRRRHDEHDECRIGSASHPKDYCAASNVARRRTLRTQPLIERRPPPPGTKHDLEQQREPSRFAHAVNALHTSRRRVGEFNAPETIVDRHEDMGQPSESSSRRTSNTLEYARRSDVVVTERRRSRVLRSCDAIEIDGDEIGGFGIGVRRDANARFRPSRRRCPGRSCSRPAAR